ncbi:hypothetical protein SAMN05444149_1217 [Pseudosulfitobacter pseudonitzschiae]|jgi:hypothetical protein|uniref:Alpha/beta hydrolase family protein n=1 Tax=Pseudosulfitobacter pseudonitzschiae TaxID=1402135 RepID=A0A073IVR4_9RHOB|nr:MULTISPECIES: hypothetical protein [Roseobacteraceae]MBA97562.1 hypothetical protein [Roseobacter sp.]OZB20128.1 MAG: hypothetical protein B7X55_01345 [Rhodobacterales bacterium 34-62-10]KEJ93710.1 hypothetical protein SUH3_16175 [Pseudosulfitobacter pseudonitzschiae]MDR6267064.1 hypothetical protein [Roseobacter sp. N2S]QKS11126.1 hypothetical protein HT745_21265 [Pseudosulfitobacter pseudonitzschiae]|tara:strand:+ start:910 stop:1725 length:816 start_codon:yes stop_codon:yes gene_type:complete
MYRRTFVSGVSAGVLAMPALGQTALPLPIGIPDPKGESTLLPAVGSGPRPLIYLSHRLGGVPEMGRQNDAPWIMFGAMQRAGWTILRSADAGPETYGNDQALAYCARMCGKAIERMDWDGRLFSLGISMGAIPALLMTWRGLFPHPVRAVATVAGVMNLTKIHASPSDRRARIDAAYNVTQHFPFEQASKGHDPLNDFHSFSENRIPLLAVASSDDALLPIDVHAGPMIETSRAIGSPSELMQISGSHIGDEHFTEQMAGRVLDFFTVHGR